MHRMRMMKILAGGLAVLALTTTAFAQSATPASGEADDGGDANPPPAASARGTLTAVDTAANTHHAEERQEGVDLHAWRRAP